MKTFWVMLCCLLPALGVAQTEFPYVKLLSMSTEQLRAEKFKYDKDRNREVLRKSNGWQVTANVLSALGGTTGDIRPAENDYEVVIQYGEQGIAYVEVTFFKDETYHDLLTFAHDQGEDLLETNSGKLDKIQFQYAGYAFELTRRLQEVKTTTDRTAALTKTFDESYNVYRYVIWTGRPASSDWLTRQAQKQEKRAVKGKKKQDVSSFM